MREEKGEGGDNGKGERWGGGRRGGEGEFNSLTFVPSAPVSPTVWLKVGNLAGAVHQTEAAMLW